MFFQDFVQEFAVNIIETLKEKNQIETNRSCSNHKTVQLSWAKYRKELDQGMRREQYKAQVCGREMTKVIKEAEVKGITRWVADRLVTLAEVLENRRLSKPPRKKILG